MAITCDLLDGYGFDTVAAADGHDALQQLERRHVDLIITDQYMAGMDGWNLCCRPREPGGLSCRYCCIRRCRRNGRSIAVGAASSMAIY